MKNGGAHSVPVFHALTAAAPPRPYSSTWSKNTGGAK